MRLFLAALLAAASASAATVEEAHKAAPRADLSLLQNDQQRSVFLEVAADVSNYAGCQDTLLKCLAANVKDPHAVRMAELVARLAGLNASAQVISTMVENYDDAFDPKPRLQIKDAGPTLGKGPVAIGEFSDCQCPH